MNNHYFKFQIHQSIPTSLANKLFYFKNNSIALNFLQLHKSHATPWRKEICVIYP